MLQFALFIAIIGFRCFDIYYFIYIIIYCYYWFQGASIFIIIFIYIIICCYYCFQVLQVDGVMDQVHCPLMEVLSHGEWMPPYYISLYSSSSTKTIIITSSNRSSSIIMVFTS